MKDDNDERKGRRRASRTIIIIVIDSIILENQFITKAMVLLIRVLLKTSVSRVRNDMVAITIRKNNEVIR
jgi:hypothetical protein